MYSCFIFFGFFNHLFGPVFPEKILFSSPLKIACLKKKKVYNYRLHCMWCSLWDYCKNQINHVMKHTFLHMLLLCNIKKGIITFLL